MQNRPKIIECQTQEEVAATFPVMHELRPHLKEDRYGETVSRLRAEGAILIGAFDGANCLGCAVFRRTTRLFTGPMVYVDDLVTTSTRRSQGVGAHLLDWIEAWARARDVAVIALDSGVQRGAAHRFYMRQGYTITSFNFKKGLHPQEDR